MTKLCRCDHRQPLLIGKPKNTCFPGGCMHANRRRAAPSTAAAIVGAVRWQGSIWAECPGKNPPLSDCEGLIWRECLGVQLLGKGRVITARLAVLHNQLAALARISNKDMARTVQDAIAARERELKACALLQE